MGSHYAVRKLRTDQISQVFPLAELLSENLTEEQWSEYAADLLASAGDEAWMSALGDGWVSPSYGVKVKAPVLNFIHQGPLRPLMVAIMPAEGAPDDPVQWLADAAGDFPA